jgi:hypothetical protein
MSTLYRVPSIDASYQVSVHLAERLNIFAGLIFNRGNEKKAFLLAHFAKGNVSFCHHLASVVCRVSKKKLLFSHRILVLR